MPGTGNGCRARVFTCSAIMLTVVTGVAGCGGKTDAGGSSTATSTSATALSTSAVSPTATTSSVPSTPTAPSTGNPALGINGLPDAAKQKTTDGAIAFVKYYVAVLNETGYRPKAGLLEPLATSNCKTCRNFEDSVRSRVSEGLHTDGPLYKEPGSYTVAANLTDLSTPGAHIRVKFGSPTIHEVRKDGSFEQTYPAETTKNVYLLIWSEGWRVDQVLKDAQ